MSISRGRGGLTSIGARLPSEARHGTLKIGALRHLTAYVPRCAATSRSIVLIDSNTCEEGDAGGGIYHGAQDSIRLECPDE